MNIHEKHSIYKKLITADESEIKADIALLQQKNPKSAALETSSFDMVRKEEAVLWDLLDVASVEEIEAARKPKAAEEALDGVTTENSESSTETTTIEQSSSPDLKKKAKKKNTPTSSGRKMSWNLFKKQ